MANLTTQVSPTHTILEEYLDDIISVYGAVTEQYLEVVETEAPSQLLRLHSDLVLKMTRLIANLALLPSIGTKMKGMAELEALIDLIPKVGGQEELLLNIVGCLANLSFYMDPGSRLFTCTYLALGSKK